MSSDASTPGGRAGAAGRDLPLPLEAFERYRDPAGPRTLVLDLSGVAVELSGLPETLAEAMIARYGPFLGAGDGTGRPLRVMVRSAPLDYFIPPPPADAAEYYRAPTAYDGSIFRLTTYRLAAWFDVRNREGQVLLGAGGFDPAPRAMENFLRSAVAWLAIDRGGLFLHGAGIVRRGRCYLFYGPTGAGKSTLAALSREGDVISDDLSLLLREPGGLVAAGSPFRGTYTGGGPVTGRFPVAGFYRLRKDQQTAVRPGDAGCFADLLGNLPWVVDQLPRFPDLIDQVHRTVEGSRFAYLHFRMDEDFWPAIDRAERG
ncbi:MAG TPA: hypothetical protein VMQ62_01375 [Dongiaceae bacterium]|nr:hypothetical protein [Dongiaceae bacterium]